MPAILHTALLFLINTLFDLYLFILALRILLASIRADYFNPFTQLIVRLTDQLVKPLRKYIKNVKNVEIASIILALCFESSKFFLLTILSSGIPTLSGILILACADLLKIFIQILFYAIVLQAILSWMRAPFFLNQILYQITSPIMRPLQQYLPRVGGFDLSPIPALILLQLLTILLVSPLTNYGIASMFKL